jgi:hypothetical protein
MSENSIVISNNDINNELNKNIYGPQKYIEYMFNSSLLIKCSSKKIKIFLLIFLNCIIIIGGLSPVWYPNYYHEQSDIWTAHIILLWPSYNYLFYLRNKWKDVSLLENIKIPSYTNYVSLFFYFIFMSYWAYFACIMLYENRNNGILFQIGNVFMALVWYLFFSTSSTLYYYTSILLLQRATVIKKQIKSLKVSDNLKKDFYVIYDTEYKKNRKLANIWNRYIFVVILVLFFNIPIDLIAIYFKGILYGIPGVVIKLFGFIWYIICVCKLNHMEKYSISYLHKHHYLTNEIDEITKYTTVRPLCLNFYGIRITFEIVMKMLLILINLIIPTIYGLISNKIFK